MSPRARSSAAILAASVMLFAVCVLAGGCTAILGVTDIEPASDGDSGSMAPEAGLGIEAAIPSDAGGGVDAAIGQEDACGAETPTMEASDDGPYFNNLVQIDVTSSFNANTIVTTAEGGVPLTWMDGTGATADDDFPTVSAAVALGGLSNFGLPDNAFFPSVGPTIPTVQLWWTNASNLNFNSYVLSAQTEGSCGFNVPPANYTQVQIYATGVGGPITLSYSLIYADGKTVGWVPISDWCAPTPYPPGAYVAPSEFALGSVHRVEFGTTWNTSDGGEPLWCNIYGLNLNPDPCRVLTSVGVSVNFGMGLSQSFVFYGATAW